MFKKNAWIVGLLIALTMMFVGCVEPEPAAEGELVELVKLSTILEAAPVGVITDWGSIFDGTPFHRCGGDAKFEITADKKLKISGMKQTWGEGFDIYNGPAEGGTGIGFKEKDEVYIKGSADLDKGFFVNLKGGAFAKWNNWSPDAEAFEQTVVLSAADVGEIKGGNPQTIRLHFEKGDRKGTIIFEEIIVTGLRKAGEEEKPVLYDIKGAGAYKYDAIVDAKKPTANEVYLDLNTAVVSTLTPATNIFERHKDKREAEITEDALTVKFTTNTQAIFIPFTDEVKALIRARALLGNKFGVSIEATANQTASHVRWGFASGTNSNWDISNLINTNNFNPSLLETTFGATLTPNLGRIDTLNGFILQARPEGNADVKPIAVPYTVTIKSIKIQVLPGNAITSLEFVLPAPVAGLSAKTSIEGKMVTGYDVGAGKDIISTVANGAITWSPAIPPSGKYDIDTAYEATITLSAVGGYYLTPNVVFVDTDVVDSLGDTVFLAGIGNTIYTTTFPQTAHEVALLKDGEIFKLSDWLKTNTTMGWPFQQAGSPTYTLTAAGITVTNRTQNYEGFDILLNKLDADVEADPTTYKLKVVVSGKIIDAKKGGEARVALQGSDRPWAWYGGTPDYGEAGALKTGDTFTITLAEIPADFYSADSGMKLRIQTGSSDTSDFQITEIIATNEGAR